MGLAIFEPSELAHNCMSLTLTSKGSMFSLMLLTLARTRLNPTINHFGIKYSQTLFLLMFEGYFLIKSLL
jgi:hypothetical protein